MITYEFDQGTFHVASRTLDITEQDEEAILAATYQVPAYNSMMNRLSQRLVEFFQMPPQGTC